MTAALQPTTATLRTADGGELRCPAKTVAPGLTLAAACAGWWTITHTRSGLAVASFDDPETAAAFAFRIAGEADWGLPAGDLINPDLARAVIAARLHYGGQRHGPSAAGAQLTDLDGGGVMASWCDGPQTAEQLAAKPRRRPWDEVLPEFAAATGRPYWAVKRRIPTDGAKGAQAGNRW